MNPVLQNNDSASFSARVPLHQSNFHIFLRAKTSTMQIVILQHTGILFNNSPSACKRTNLRTNKQQPCRLFFKIQTQN